MSRSERTNPRQVTRLTLAVPDGIGMDRLRSLVNAPTTRRKTSVCVPWGTRYARKAIDTGGSPSSTASLRSIAGTSLTMKA